MKTIIRFGRGFFSLLAKKNSDFWIKQGRLQSIQLFKAAAKRVPAYRDFLRERKIQAKNITTWDAFKTLPPMDRPNFFYNHPLSALTWDGVLKNPLSISSTSGSTGKAQYFARDKRLDLQAAIVHQFFLKNSGYQKTTLVVDAFGMGAWIAGVITYRAFQIVSEENDLPISIITPGINKKEIVQILKRLAPQYDQLVLAGYAPFIKDVIDTASAEHVNFPAGRTRLLFAAEVLPESLRSHFDKKLRFSNFYYDTMNIYGTAELGAMAFETPFTILVRRLALRSSSLYQALFGKNLKIPTLAQYIPTFVNFEEHSGHLYVTGDSATPFLRYDIGDEGGVFSYKEIIETLKAQGVNIKKELARAGIKEAPYQLPLVYVYERRDMTVTLYGLQIYPTVIRNGLHTAPFANRISGKFALSTKFDHKKNQYLEVNMELLSTEHPNSQLRREIQQYIYHYLREKSSEYRELSDYLGRRALPVITLWPNGHDLFFNPKAKHRWIVK